MAPRGTTGHFCLLSILRRDKFLTVRGGVNGSGLQSPALGNIRHSRYAIIAPSTLAVTPVASRYDRHAFDHVFPSISSALWLSRIRSATRSSWKWVTENIKYDASVPYEARDLAAIVHERKGHCGHQMTMFGAMCARAGIPTRAVVGLNLNTPGGVGDLHKIRPDFENQHTWVQV